MSKQSSGSSRAMKHKLLLITALAAAALSCENADAAAITGNIRDNGGAGGEFTKGGSLFAATPSGSPVGVNEYLQDTSSLADTGATGFTANVVLLTARVDFLYTPIDALFSRTGLATDARAYSVSVDMTNNAQFQISPTHFELLNATGTGPAVGVRFADYPEFTPTSEYNTAFEPITDHLLVFGGLNGGGGQLLQGQTSEFKFGIVLDSGTASDFILRMTANPEPSSLALGFSVVGVVGAIRRRRRAKASAENEST